MRSRKQMEKWIKMEDEERGVNGKEEVKREGEKCERNWGKG